MAGDNPPPDVVIEDPGGTELRVVVAIGATSFVADEPIEIGGTASGPTPYDLLCAALGSCTAMTLKLYARRKAIALAHVNVDVSHAKQDGKDLFSRTIHLDGKFDEVTRARLLEIAEHCPIHRTLSGGSLINTMMGMVPRGGLGPPPGYPQKTATF